MTDTDTSNPTYHGSSDMGSSGAEDGSGVGEDDGDEGGHEDGHACTVSFCQNSVLKGKNTFQEVWKECRQVSGFGVVSSEK